jgi:hypothetical protein
MNTEYSLVKTHRYYVLCCKPYTLSVTTTLSKKVFKKSALWKLSKAVLKKNTYPRKKHLGK